MVFCRLGGEILLSGKETTSDKQSCQSRMDWKSHNSLTIQVDLLREIRDAVHEKEVLKSLTTVPSEGCGHFFRKLREGVESSPCEHCMKLPLRRVFQKSRQLS